MHPGDALFRACVVSRKPACKIAQRIALASSVRFVQPGCTFPLLASIDNTLPSAGLCNQSARLRLRAGHERLRQIANWACFGRGAKAQENSLAYSLFVRYTILPPIQEEVCVAFALPFCLAISRCMNFGPSFLWASTPLTCRSPDNDTILDAGIKYGIMRLLCRQRARSQWRYPANCSQRRNEPAAQASPRPSVPDCSSWRRREPTLACGSSEARSGLLAHWQN